jgi:predicted RND superfamily exporter protein
VLLSLLLPRPLPPFVATVVAVLVAILESLRVWSYVSCFPTMSSLSSLSLLLLSFCLINIVVGVASFVFVVIAVHFGLARSVSLVARIFASRQDQEAEFCP